MEIADFISTHFEPAWQSVRPAAIVRVDFGNGHVLTRTLNGNIATSVCHADGTVLEVIPGVYDPAAYLDRLNQAALLARWADQQAVEDVRFSGSDYARRSHPRRPASSPEGRAEFLKTYHREQARSLREHREPKVIVEIPDRPGAIVRVEAGLKLVLRSSLRGTPAGVIADSRRDGPGAAQAEGPFDLPAELASRVGRLEPAALRKDTRYNESVRRLKLHDYLAEHSPTRSADMLTWLYRDVLDTDLDDPYLGVGKVLFATYPFGDEDVKH